jgi:hypothetical protein
LPDVEFLSRAMAKTIYDRPDNFDQSTNTNNAGTARQAVL